MLAIEARSAGFRTVIRTDGAPGGPAAQVADAEVAAPYDDEHANARFATMVDVVTAEFENLPIQLLDWLEARIPTRPGSKSITTCQHRATEKRFLAANKISCAEFRIVDSEDQAHRAFAELGPKAVLKSAAFGYDGKGQARLNADDDAGLVFRDLGVGEAVMEALVPFVKEISVIGARTVDGHWVSLPPGENVHVDGVLDTTIAPARISPGIAGNADEIAHRIADALEHVGTLAVEMFVLADDTLIVNEIAPRPHNSGHHSIEACSISQFGLQLQAVIGSALTTPVQHSIAVMVNLLGDVWANGEPDWSVVSGDPSVVLHLYGKASARPGRKMGHLTVLGSIGDDPEELLQKALSLRQALLGPTNK
jgi:5-(carboxyamino)imidazole ribonucleotide synthase